MSQKTLRELAKGYARGEIDKDSYRKSRGELIEGIIAGKIAVKVIDYPPPLVPSDDDKAITENIQRDRTEVRPPNAKTPPPAQQSTTASANTPSPKTEKKSPIVFISVSAAIVILLIIGVVLFYPKPPSSTPIAVSNSASTVETNSVTATTSNNMAGESLIADFLGKKNWSEESLDNFVNSWIALTQEERDAATQTKRMRRMHDSIYKQFLQEKALASIDSEKATVKLQQLIGFANAIGIDDSRLTIDL